MLLEAERGLCGYFVLTWGFDLEWNGRDAFLSELFLIPDARGKALGAAALSWRVPEPPPHFLRRQSPPEQLAIARNFSGSDRAPPFCVAVCSGPEPRTKWRPR